MPQTLPSSTGTAAAGLVADVEHLATLSSLDDVHEYLLYLVWVCGVPVHVRYAAALLALTVAGAELTTTEEELDSFLAEARRAQFASAAIAEGPAARRDEGAEIVVGSQSPAADAGLPPRHRDSVADVRGGDAQAARLLRAVVLRDVFPRLLRASAALSAAAAQQLPATLSRHEGCGSTVVALSARGCSDGAAPSAGRSGVNCVSVVDAADGAVEVLALRGGTEGGDEWRSAVYAAALVQAAAMERLAGGRATHPTALRPVAQRESEVGPERAPPKRRLEDFFSQRPSAGDTGGGAAAATPPEVVVIDCDSDE